MDETGMTPRITVPDSRDALLVREALTALVEGALIKRAIELLDCLNSDTDTQEDTF